MQTIIHIGCPKTGTTTLQRHLFRELPGVHYLGHYSRLNPKLQRVPHRARGHEQVPEDWRKAVARAPADAERILYSQEKLTYYPASLAPRIAEETRAIVGDARIFITIRRQQDVCISNYFNYVATGYTGDFSTFMADGMRCMEETPDMAMRKRPECIWDLWRYRALYEAWEEVFGQVDILPLEAWKAQPERARATLVEVLGQDDVELPGAKARSRASNIPWRDKLPRPLAQFIKRTPWPDWMTRRWQQDLNVELTADQHRTIEEVYGPHNRWLAERTGWDLRALGYPGWAES